MPKHPGGPKPKMGENATKQINFRVTPPAYEKIQKKAHDSGVSVLDYTRNLVINHVEKEHDDES
jgi:hypothetical protein